MHLAVCQKIRSNQITSLVLFMLSIIYISLWVPTVSTNPCFITGFMPIRLLSTPLLHSGTNLHCIPGNTPSSLSTIQIKSDHLIGIMLSIIHTSLWVTTDTTFPCWVTGFVPIRLLSPTLLHSGPNLHCIPGDAPSSLSTFHIKSDYSLNQPQPSLHKLICKKPFLLNNWLIRRKGRTILCQRAP